MLELRMVLFYNVSSLNARSLLLYIYESIANQLFKRLLGSEFRADTPTYPKKHVAEPKKEAQGVLALS